MNFLKDKKIAEAFELMVSSHYGQKYGNRPYFTHPLEIVSNINKPSRVEVIVAFLHDVIEDSPVTMKDIEKQFGVYIAETIDLMTRKKDQTYSEYIKEIIGSGNVIAINIKYLDNLVNYSNLKDNKSLKQRYMRSMLMLSPYTSLI